ncbi:MAG: sensor histidine kinase N-terminal domain-containing protein [Variovorax sp.]
MRKPEPRLQRKLLTWLLGPLAVLLVLDTAAAYWNSLRFSNLAYDRALHEIGREIVLHVKLDGTRPRLDLSQAAAHILLLDQDDLLFYRVFSADGTALGGDAELPPPRAAEPPAPRFYRDSVHGEPVRMLVASMPIGGNPGAPMVLVQVAETLHKRTQLAWEMVVNVVVPQLLLIVMATAVVWFGVSRGLDPLQRLRARCRIARIWT